MADLTTEVNAAIAAAILLNTDEPILERIALAIKAVLECVTTDNGCKQSIAEVVRPARLGGFEPRNLLAILQQEDADESSEPQGGKSWAQTFAVDLIVRPSESDSTALDTRINRFRADVEKALAVDLQFGGLAANAYVRPPEQIISPDGAFEGVRVRLEVTYRTSETDPYSLR